ncbi:MAG: hypothetical protein Q8R76_04370 [Candidatus Omnitrophota bacterium]|nr:hypothetical protein [Candidatus Omnitrophota bacterium]
MIDWLQLVIAFGTLLCFAQSEESAENDFSQRRGILPGALQSLAGQGIELGIKSALLVACYVLLRRIPVGGGWEPPAVLYALPAAFVISGMGQHKSAAFFLSLFGFTTYLLLYHSKAAPAVYLLMCLQFSVLITTYRILILGMRQRLLFADVPQPVRGAPILFLTASLCALILAGLQGILP